MNKQIAFRSLGLRNACVISSVLLGLIIAQVDAQTFDFESTAATYNGSGARPGAFTSLALTNAGLTMTITRQNAGQFDVVDNSGGSQTGKPASWGNRSLDPFFPYNNAGTPPAGSTNGFIANFSQAISAFAMQFGDYSLPDADVLTLTAWSGLNGSGSMIAQVVVSQTTGFPLFDTAAVSGLSFLSVTWSSTTTDPFPNSLFYDNFTARVAPTAAPENGSSVLLLAIGVVALFAGRSLKSRARLA
ncbi:MAG TPA: hypothetical protein VGC85_08785 [Chthoniobacterales bacterium]|jgi:hypothetical protein